MYLDMHGGAARCEGAERGMFERFTDPARRVVVLAEEEARMLGHDYIGTEHLLLGLVHEGDGVVAEALGSLGISREAVRQRAGEAVGQGRQASPESIPFLLRAKKALELSRREAFQLGHSYIGPEHILLGLLREGDGVAARVLAGLGADLNRVRQQVIRLLADFQGSEELRSGRAAMRSGLAGGRQQRLLPEALERLRSIDAQLAAMGQWMGAGPEAGDLDQRIAQVHRDMEAAARAGHYESAAALRNRERQLLVDRTLLKQEGATSADRASLARELRRLREELQGVRDLLRRHGTDPQDGAA
jgi:ATP-dependent Clp protease ATP-binding subunit ClpA